MEDPYSYQTLESTCSLDFGRGEGFKWWYGTLWFHFNKLDPTIRSEVESIAKDMPSGDGLSDLDLYLNLIGQEVERTRQELNRLTEVARQTKADIEL